MDSKKLESSFVVFSGMISNLQVISSESNLFLNQENRRLGALATLGLAAIGESGSAATSLQHASGGDIKLQLFRCEVDGKIVYGCFSRVFFADGEQVDIVAEPQEDGGFYAYSVRRPIDHRLWLPFYCERGTKAHKKSNMIMASWLPAITIFIGFFMIIYKLISADRSMDIIFKVVGIFFVVSIIWFLFLFFVCYGFLKGLTGHSQLAEKIFITLGYKNPALLDMNKENAQFIKDCKEHGEFYYVPDTKQYQQILVAPCVYHYRIAPEVPEKFKLKE
ncbi:putative type VI secretion system effector [Pragia fontium]|nr:putative type VI secretion system effector [Pragia fontium]